MEIVHIIFAIFVVVLVVLSAGLLIYYVDKNRTQTPSAFSERRAQLKWGGLSIDYRSPLDYAQASEGGYLPITNSMKAIERIQAAYNTPPWSDNRAEATGDATVIHIQKKSKAQDTFRVDKIRSPTSTRDMSV